MQHLNLEHNVVQFAFTNFQHFHNVLRILFIFCDMQPTPVTVLHPKDSSLKHLRAQNSCHNFLVSSEDSSEYVFQFLIYLMEILLHKFHVFTFCELFKQPYSYFYHKVFQNFIHVQNCSRESSSNHNQLIIV